MKDSIEIGGRNYESTKQLRNRLGITYQTLLVWTQNGTLPEPIKLGTRVFYDKELVDRQILYGGAGCTRGLALA
jgi:DNA-binding transcriptional MerR regulator